MISAQNIASTAVWAALCLIRKGEEVFTTYLGGATRVPRETRQKMLMPWLGQKCGCVIGMQVGQWLSCLEDQ
jgi:hypothetical protein